MRFFAFYIVVPLAVAATVVSAVFGLDGDMESAWKSAAVATALLWMLAIAKFRPPDEDEYDSMVFAG